VNIAALTDLEVDRALRTRIAVIPFHRSSLVNRRLALLAGLLIFLLIGLATRLTLRDRGPSAVGPAEFYEADPVAAPAPDEWKGSWTATVTSPAGDARRESVIRFVDATHLVWEFTHVSRDGRDGPEVRATTALRGRYKIIGSELQFSVTDRAIGDRTFPPKPEDKEPRRYEFTRLTGDSGFHVRPKPSEPGFNWFELTFHRAPD
jgi:hypothetical protein